MDNSRRSSFAFRSRSVGPALLALAAAACARAPVQEENVVVVGTDAGHSEPQLPPPPNVRVNQVGYLPGFAKYAAVVNAAASPLAWELVDSGGQVVQSGQTEVFGADADSGDNVHRIDFSSFQQTGRGYKLRVGQDESYPFDVAPDIYRQMKYDAIWYFYHNRSGIEITMPYAGQEQWTRPAGHLSDKSVPCAPEAGCDYSLDVTGGWYDAGDHGKYVVNGGISLWTLHNMYEHMQHRAKREADDYGDGKLRIPENTNGRSDLLDEARWELEWMLKMQVPEGQEKAGMAHHKMHDAQWAGLGFRPPTDAAKAKLQRYLRPVSTAATLNLAAAAAQGARIWKQLDAVFSQQCLAAAERAWQAAQKYPAVYAKVTDTTGGGPYDDDNVVDEQYWAAAELYITTGKAEYKDAIAKSPHYLKIPQGCHKDGGGVPSAMTWQMVAALGTISLAVVPNKLGKADLKKAQDAIVATADNYLGLIAKQGYRLPMAAEGGKYPWGSNSFVLNNQVILALAHDFTKQDKYLVGVLDGMNYILGVNAMGQSYVSGYGARPLRNPHHRFWAYQLSDVFPPPPPGCVSGGPNSGLEDPTAASRLKGCKPQKCFIDHIQSWSTNEITINWNAPLSWITAFIDGQAKAKAGEA
jgi:endoglucanase